MVHKMYWIQLTLIQFVRQLFYSFINWMKNDFLLFMGHLVVTKKFRSQVPTVVILSVLLTKNCQGYKETF